MSKNLDFVKSYLDMAWSNPPSSLLEAAMKYLADDFKNMDSDGNVLMNKETYLGMSQLLFSAFKDFKWVLKDLMDGDDGVIMVGHFEGIHTGDLDLSAMGAGVIPASGRKIVWPESTVKWGIKNNKVVTQEAVGNSGGMDEFLAVLGAKAPNEKSKA